MNPLAVTTRSGLIETLHHGALAVCDSDGGLVAWSGDIDRPFYLRSAAKPFQAMVAQEAGAELSPTQTAVACASHDGEPVHLALVESMLEEVGLRPERLACTPGWPLSPSARDRLVANGERAPRPWWHNCSGKHAAWLRACVARSWDLGSYLDPGHPLQRGVVELVEDLGRFSAGPVGVDGCGAPVLRTSARAMARLYAALAAGAALEPVRSAMHRYPALVSGVGNGDALLAVALDAVAKRAASGCLGLARRNGYGLAVKVWDGSQVAAQVAAVAAISAVEPLPSHVSAELGPVGRPPVLGGGNPVGSWEPRLELRWR